MWVAQDFLAVYILCSMPRSIVYFDSGLPSKIPSSVHLSSTDCFTDSFSIDGTSCHLQEGSPQRFWELAQNTTCTCWVWYCEVSFFNELQWMTAGVTVSRSNAFLSSCSTNCTFVTLSRRVISIAGDGTGKKRGSWNKEQAYRQLGQQKKNKKSQLHWQDNQANEESKGWHVGEDDEKKKENFS